jgi:YVTN family beta-propeller protein
VATAFDGVAATLVPLRTGAAPIDVAYAFGSIWVANHRTNTVSRIDPATLEELAHIQVGAGPGWFVATEDAIWVSSQLGRGLSRIDPTTNKETDRAGSWATCGAPIVAFGSIWQSACDAGQIMRIDPTTYNSIDIAANEHGDIVLVGETIIAVSPAGLARLDPETGDFEEIGGFAGHLVGSDGTTVWLADDDHVVRVNPADGATVSTLPIPNAELMRAAGDHVWLVQAGIAVLEVELATNDITRTVAMPATVALEADGALWVTGFDNDSLWRLEPG